MAKIILPNVNTGFNPATMNQNFQDIAEELSNDVLYRNNPDGEPNQMLNLLDMNGNRIINLPEPVADHEPMRRGDAELIVTEFAQPVIDAANQATIAAGIATEAANNANAAATTATSTAASALGTANAAQTTANTALTNANNAVTTANGIEATANTALSNAATADGKAVAAQSTATSATTNINTFKTDVAASSGSGLVGFIQPGTGAVLRTVQNKLREMVSVTDFGAVGNGSTNDLAAINAAITFCSDTGGGKVFFPKGTYRVTGSIQYKVGVELHGEGWAGVTLLWYPTTNVGGNILNTVNVPLNRAVFKGFRFAKHSSITANTTGIIGGATFANYNSAVAKFEDLLFDGLTYGIRGNAEPTGVGFFDCLFSNCWFQQCFYGLWLFGSGNRVDHCRFFGCDSGIALDYLNSESYDGMIMTGGIHVANQYDIAILSASGIRPTTFIGVWHESAVQGIINIQNPNTNVMNLTFSGCMLSSYSTTVLANFTNANGTVSLEACTFIAGSATASQAFIRPTNPAARLIMRKCHQYNWAGAPSFVSNFTAFEITKGNVPQSITGGATTLLTWNNLAFDTVAGWNAANNRFVIQDPGFYKVSATVAFAPESSSTSQDTVVIYRNGVATRSAINASNSTANHTVNVEAILNLAAGDYIDIRALHANATPINILGNNDLTRFSVHMISER